ncbi:MAG: hypothetical protein HYZ81_24415 [Nitrospinae bacterium]|nr:hypothetical protein [Nitrospinota bacterium]
MAAARWQKGTYPMCVVRSALIAVLVAAAISSAWAMQSQPSIELGDLHAVPSSGPAHVFQLPIFRQAQAPLDMPTIIVRRPSDVLFFVGNNTLELRMLELADVELEISYAGRTVNRLLLKTELQAARARLQSGIAWDRYQQAKAMGSKGPRLARLYEEVDRTQQEWARLDPDGARDQLRRVVRERKHLPEQSFGPEEARGLGGGSRPKAEGEALGLENRMAGLEREMVGIREGIQGLLGHVIALPNVWNRGGVERYSEEETFSRLLAVMLGGLFMAGIASLLTAYSMQRRALHRERQRRRVLVAAMHMARDMLPPAGIALPALHPMPMGMIEKAVDLQRVPTLVRRVKVSYKASRRVYVKRSQEQETWTHLMPGERALMVPPQTLTEIAEASHREATRANLWRGLLSSLRCYISPPTKTIRGLLAKLSKVAKYSWPL